MFLYGRDFQTQPNQTKQQQKTIKTNKTWTDKTNKMAFAQGPNYTNYSKGLNTWIYTVALYFREESFKNR